MTNKHKQQSNDQTQIMTEFKQNGTKCMPTTTISYKLIKQGWNLIILLTWNSNKQQWSNLHYYYYDMLYKED